MSSLAPRSLALALLGVLFFLAGVASADRTACDEYRSGKVLIEACRNYKVSALSDDMSMPAMAQGIEALRGQLVDRGFIQDLPLEIHIPETLWRTHLAIYDPCESLSSEALPAPIDPCYHIEFDQRSYDALRGMVAGLRYLSQSRRHIEPSTPWKLIESGRAVTGVEVRPDPFVSPDGGLEVQPVWTDGSLRYELRNEPGQWLRALPMPRGPRATDPVWSSDNAQYAIASLLEVVVVNAKLNRVRRHALPKVGDATERVFMAFDTSGRRLVVTHTAWLGWHYATTVFDTATRRQRRCTFDMDDPDSHRCPGVTFDGMTSAQATELAAALGSS
jgi:hypothetical protein